MTIENTFGNINFNGVDLSQNNIFVQHYPLMGAPSRRQTAISGIAHRNAVFDEKEYDNVEVELNFVIVADTFDELSDRRSFLFRTLDVGGYVPVKIDPDPFIYYMYRTSDMKETLFDGNPLNWIRVITVTFSRDPFKYYDVKSSATKNNLGQINQLFNTEFSPDFSGWYSRGNSISSGIEATLGTPVNGSNTFTKVDTTTTRLQSYPIAVIPGTKISYSVQKLASSKIWSYINNVDVDGNMVNVPGTSSPEFGDKESVGYTKVENITIPSGVEYISFGLYLAGISNGNVFSQPMLVFSDHVGAYVQGLYDSQGSIPVTTSGTTISNPSNYDSLPKITIYANTGTGTTNVSINGVIQLKNVNGNIILDSMLEDAYWLDSSGNYVNGNSSMVKPYFPKLQPKLNAITFDSTVSKVVITPRWRTL